MLTKTIVINGKSRDTTPVEVSEATRPWTDFLLADGTRLRVHVVIDAVHRLVGEYDARGYPMYYVNSRTVSSSSSPEELRNPPQAVV
jgi:hypothetical protein